MLARTRTTLFLAYAMLAFASASPAHATKIIDWVGIFTDVNVTIGQFGFEKDEVNLEVGQEVTFHNESGRELRVVAGEGVKLSTPPITKGGSARILFMRPGTFQLFCPKPCKKPINVIVKDTP